MSRRLFTLIVAFVVGGGPLGRELCQILCASTSAVSSHTRHSNAQLDSHRHHREPQLELSAFGHQHQMPMPVPAGAHRHQADDSAGVTPASRLCGNSDGSLVSVVPPGGPSVSDRNPLAAATLALESILIHSGCTHRSPDVRSPIPLTLLTPLRV
jgi:hypothetical protein